jgi:hypothetical protein
MIKSDRQEYEKEFIKMNLADIQKLKARRQKLLDKGKSGDIRVWDLTAKIESMRREGTTVLGRPWREVVLNEDISFKRSKTSSVQCRIDFDILDR